MSFFAASVARLRSARLGAFAGDVTFLIAVVAVVKKSLVSPWLNEVGGVDSPGWVFAGAGASLVVASTAVEASSSVRHRVDLQFGRVLL